MMERKRRPLKAINAGSMADIAFLLLVFFLVTTTMNPDLGLMRKLPPIEDSSGEIKRRNVLEVLVNEQNQLMIGGSYASIGDLKSRAKVFIENPDNIESLPEKRALFIPGMGDIMVSKQVISLQNHPLTSFGTYIDVQDALAAAYHELRNELALKEFNKSYDDLIVAKDVEKVAAVRKAIPQRISEAEPNL